ncbi:elongin-C-like [Melanaphis sacchari]|uniref:elongin-C-like n=1 Tax=Melanaphis sacchari TaxID=742174 RepID=UPI000DC14443|nr:elongin-C-like [Melanaphis sacchari]
MADSNATQGNKNDSDLEVFGDCNGPNSEYVKLISSDGLTFIVKREYALTSATIKAMLEGPGQFAETECNEINFKDIPSHILHQVCLYFAYKSSKDKSKDSDLFDASPFEINPIMALDLMMAANFLDC